MKEGGGAKQVHYLFPPAVAHIDRTSLASLADGDRLQRLADLTDNTKNILTDKDFTYTLASFGIFGIGYLQLFRNADILIFVIQQHSFEVFLLFDTLALEAYDQSVP